MTRSRTLVFPSVVALVATLALYGCEGKTGPMGPQGVQGEQGEQGPPGQVTRTILSGHVPAGDNDYFVSIPGLDMSDPGLVTTFIQAFEGEWDELPLGGFQDTDGNPLILYASPRDGGVTLYFCEDLDYIIIVLE